MIIRTTKTNRANLTVQIDGVSVSFNGELEAELTEAEALKVKAKDPKNILLEDEEAVAEAEKDLGLEKTPGSPVSPAEAEAIIAKRKAEKEAKEAELAKEVESAEDEDTETEETEEVEETEEAESAELDVASFTVAELKELCKEQDYPSKEWKSLDKAGLVAYVESKISE